MTESEYLAADDAEPIQRFLSHSLILTKRKQRLTSVAVVRYVWDKLPALHQKVLEAAELVADDLADLDKMRAKYEGRWDESYRCQPINPKQDPSGAAAWCLGDVLAATMPSRRIQDLLPFGYAASVTREVAGNPWNRPRPVGNLLEDREHGVACLREEWVFFVRYVTPNVASLAQATYDSRGDDGRLDTDTLLVLSDALEDEGCDEPKVLRHLRGEMPCPKCERRGYHRTPGSIWGPTMSCVDVSTDEWPSGVGCNGTGWVKKQSPCVRGCWCIDMLLGKS
jgi:hypothetical protein